MSGTTRTKYPVRVMHFIDYFISKKDACGMYDFSSYQKCTAEFRMLADGVVDDLVD